MSPVVGSGENSLKSRSIKLLPKTCIAIAFIRQSSTSSSPSSLSVTSDHVKCDHCDSTGSVSRQFGRSSHKCPPSKLCPSENGLSYVPQLGQQTQSSPIDRQSFSSMSTGTTTDNRDCLCQQPVNCVELFNEFVKENMLNTCFMLPANSLSKLDLVGFTYPTTLLIAGHQESLKLLCSLWSRRILKAPFGYTIRFVGKLICILIMINPLTACRICLNSDKDK